MKLLEIRNSDHILNCQIIQNSTFIKLFTTMNAQKFFGTTNLYKILDVEPNAQISEGKFNHVNFLLTIFSDIFCRCLIFVSIPISSEACDLSFF